MDKQIAFKKQLFGFSKKMVIDFIGDAYQQSAAEEDRLGRNIRELTAENERLAQQAQKDSAAIAMLQERANTEAANAQRMAEAVKTLTAEINRQKLDQNQKDYKIKQLSDRVEEYAAKEREAGELQKQAQDILEAARREADELKKQSEAALEEARREADELKRQSETALDVTNRENEELRRRRDDILEAAHREAEEIVQKAKREHADLMGGAQEERDRLQADTVSFRSDISRLKLELRRVLKEIEEKVEGFDLVPEQDGKPDSFLMEKRSALHSFINDARQWEKPDIQGVEEQPVESAIEIEDKPAQKPAIPYTTPGGFFRPAAQR